MIVDLERREARLAVGEFSDFSLGPRPSQGSGGGLWRAQIGTRWHRELRAHQEAADPASVFEVPVEGGLHRRGWTLVLSGRIDQVVPGTGGRSLIREIKTVTDALPVAEEHLRAAYPAYFIQAAAYAALVRDNPACELVFVEADTGLSQTVRVGAAAAALFEEQAALLTEFLDFRARTRERLKGLRFRPPFETLRPGQETAESDLRDAARSGRRTLLLEAPTGFGKTGVLLAFALGELREGRFERLVYVTGKSTGQIQVAATLASMTREAGEPAGSPDGASAAGGPAVTAWHVRNKAEHCVNTVFHCVRDACDYLAGSSTRWAGSGLARFYLFDNEPRDLETLRTAGRSARICPYEITRAALPFNDVWIGDYNYVFSPDSRGLFLDQPGYDRGRTLLIVDEAHNLPARAADALSHAFEAGEARAVATALGRVRAPARLAAAWDAWAGFLEGLPRRDALEAGDEEEARDLLQRLSDEGAAAPVDYAALGADLSNRLWEPAGILARLGTPGVRFLAWSPDAGELAFTCLDAAAAIGADLRSFGGVVLATATPGPGEALAESCGLAGPAAVEADLPEEHPAGPPPPERLGRLARKDTRRLFAQLASGTDLLRAEESREFSRVFHLRAAAPWRDGAYDVAVDLRVDTTFHQRTGHLRTTAETLAALAQGPGGAARPPGSPVAAFFPSYAYAEAVLRELREVSPGLRAALQPRRADLPAQVAWVEESLGDQDALLLILGSGFTESIDLLGGRVSAALVAGPALPEVNAVQRARLAAFASLGRDAAFDRAYRLPGMQKVNQALGRLVRAPGQTARVLLHCRRFAEPGYARLLQPEYRTHRRLMDDDEFASWLGS